MYQSLSYYILSVVCILILSNIPSTFSQSTITSYDCVDPNNREVTHQVRKGDITTVCLYVGPNGDWNNNIDYKRFSVNLIADEFSSYEVPGCKFVMYNFVYKICHVIVDCKNVYIYMAIVWILSCDVMPMLRIEYKSTPIRSF